MFTGVVQGLGHLRSSRTGEVEIELPPAMRDRLDIGASIAVNGVCLTVRELGDDSFRANVSRETQSRTTLGGLRPRARLNLELSVRPGDGLDGHLVLGHVDAVGRIQALHREECNWITIVSYPAEFLRYVVEKGSIAVDGISLTSYAIDGNSFRCSIIPETYEKTTLRNRKGGDPVNLEFDILAKYVERMMPFVHHD
jgi:riboflavin synthase